MKAVRIKDYGGVDELRLVADVPKPEIKTGQILVEVHAAAINPFDRKMREGYTKAYAPLEFPVTMGADFAGIVAEVGSGVEHIKSGDAVYGSAIVLGGGSGAFAEYATANAATAAVKPKNATFEEAAASVLVGVSAVQAIEEHIKLEKGQKIVIHGGAGGIGSIAIQIAKHLGAHVITTVSPDDMEFVRQLGADEVIDYKSEKFEEKVQGVDAVFDTVGGETLERSVAVLKKNGILVSMLGIPNPELLEKHEITAIGQNTKTNSANLERLTELIDTGVIKPQVDSVYTLDQVKEAFTHLEQGSPRGKVVLKMK